MQTESCEMLRYKPRIALVHYWLVGEAGGEKVVKSILNVFPTADIFTLIFDKEAASKIVGNRPIVSSFLQRIPFSKKFYRRLLGLMPTALENMDLTGYDIIISSDSGPAKGILPPLNSLHICYCHSPMRYIWDQHWEYRRTSRWLARAVLAVSIKGLRSWDFTSASRVDRFITNSNHVASRVAQYYRRDSTVIHPPVSTHDFYISNSISDFYLVTGRHVDYKRIDLAIMACNRLGKSLIITGTGPETKRLKKLAGGTILFVGQCSFEQLRDYYSTAKAFLMPGEEDFGISPVESMASGRPVIAYGRGGSLDYVVDRKTGILFDEQTVDALCGAILQFENDSSEFDPIAIKDHAELFSKDIFESRFREFVDVAMSATSKDRFI